MAKNNIKDFVNPSYPLDLNAKELRAEVSKLASMANKRLQRLENGGLTDSPAYKKWFEDGGAKFGVRGKNHNQVQQEFARLRRFINSETSTIRGINSTLKEMASNTGIKYTDMKDLRSKANQFFELASKVEQYLRTVDDMASAIGYQRIWEAINQYVEVEKINLGDSEQDIDSMVNLITEAIKGVENKKIIGAEKDNDIWWFLG